jgi:transcriptional regulator with XRE-family HTH domain
MQEPGKLIHAVRERRRISRSQLAIRAGIDEATIDRLEQGDAASPEDVRALLLVMGERPIYENGRIVSSEPIPLEFDPIELADAASQSASERLERSMQWDRFAAELARAELRPLR